MFDKLKDKIREKNYNKVNNFFYNNKEMIDFLRTNFIKKEKDTLKLQIVFGNEIKKKLKLNFLKNQTSYKLQDLLIDDFSIALYAQYNKQIKNGIYVFHYNMDKPISVIYKD